MATTPTNSPRAWLEAGRQPAGYSPSPAPNPMGQQGSTNPYITKLQGPGASKPLGTPAPIQGLNQTGPTVPPQQQARSHFNDAKRDYYNTLDEFRATERGPERQAARPQYLTARDYFRDTRDWFHGGAQGQAPQMPLQITPTYQGFPGPFPGTQPPMNPNLSPQERALEHINSLNLPPQVLERVQATLTGQGQVAQPTPQHSSPTPQPTQPRDPQSQPLPPHLQSYQDRYAQSFNDPTSRGR